MSRGPPVADREWTEGDERRQDELAHKRDPAWRQGHGAVQALLLGWPGLEDPERLRYLGVLRSTRRFAHRLLRPRGPGQRRWVEPGGQRLQRHRLQLRRSQRGPRRRSFG